MRTVALGLLLSTALVHAQETGDIRRVTLDECVKAALEKNFQIRVESYTPQISATFVKSAGAVFDPVLTAQVQNSDYKQEKTSFYSPSKFNTANFDFTLSQQLKTSTRYQLTLANTRQNTDSTFATISPYFEVNLSFRITQPVLKNFGPKIAQTRLLVAKNDKVASEEQFRASISTVILLVQRAYWNYVYALSNLEVQKQSLKLAQDLLEQNKVRVQVGTLAPIDILQSEAEVATRQETILVAENLARDYEDQLKSLMNLPGEQQDWSMRVVPADEPQFNPVPVDEAEMLKIALEKRHDLKQLRINLESDDLGLNYAKNQLRPDLSLFAQTGSTGIGGNRFEFDEQGNKIGSIAGNYGDALQDSLDYRYRNWAIGFTFTVPLANEAAEASYQQALLTSLQSQYRIKQVEHQTYQEVRAACRQVETNRLRVDSTRAALRLAEKKLEAEQKKYSVGLSTNYFVLEFQKDLSQAQTNELQAVTDYGLSLFNLDKLTGMTLENNNVEISGYLSGN